MLAGRVAQWVGAGRLSHVPVPQSSSPVAGAVTLDVCDAGVATKCCSRCTGLLHSPAAVPAPTPTNAVVVVVGGGTSIDVDTVLDAELTVDASLLPLFFFFFFLFRDLPVPEQQFFANK